MTLTIEVVPPASHNITLARVMTFADWKRVRTKCYELAGFHCEVCGGQGKHHPVECHERWEYSDTVQTLKGVIALCTACHCVKHYGRMQMLGFEEDCHAQLRKVNGWTPREVLEHVRASAKDFRAIEKCVYKIDMRWVYTYAKCGLVSRLRIDEIAQYSGILQNNRIFRQIYNKNGPKIPVSKPWAGELEDFFAPARAEHTGRETAERAAREAVRLAERAEREAVLQAEREAARHAVAQVVLRAVQRHGLPAVADATRLTMDAVKRCKDGAKVTGDTVTRIKRGLLALDSGQAPVEDDAWHKVCECLDAAIADMGKDAVREKTGLSPSTFDGVIKRGTASRKTMAALDKVIAPYLEKRRVERMTQVQRDIEKWGYQAIADEVERSVRRSPDHSTHPEPGIARQMELLRRAAAGKDAGNRPEYVEAAIENLEQRSARQAREDVKQAARAEREAARLAKRAGLPVKTDDETAVPAVEMPTLTLPDRMRRLGGTKPVLAKLARGTSHVVRQTVKHYMRGQNVNPDKVASVILPAVEACEVELRAIFGDRHETAAIPYRVRRIVKLGRYKDIRSDAFRTA